MFKSNESIKPIIAHLSNVPLKSNINRYLRSKTVHDIANREQMILLKLTDDESIYLFI